MGRICTPTRPINEANRRNVRSTPLPPTLHLSWTKEGANTVSFLRWLRWMARGSDHRHMRPTRSKLSGVWWMRRPKKSPWCVVLYVFRELPYVTFIGIVRSRREGRRVRIQHPNVRVSVVEASSDSTNQTKNLVAISRRFRSVAGLELAKRCGAGSKWCTCIDTPRPQRPTRRIEAPSQRCVRTRKMTRSSTRFRVSKFPTRCSKTRTTKPTSTDGSPSRIRTIVRKPYLYVKKQAHLKDGFNTLDSCKIAL